MLGLTAIEFYLLVIAVFVVLFWIFPKKVSWLPMLITVIMFSYLAFNVEPNVSDDLDRYYKMLDYLREGGSEALKRCFEENLNNWRTYRCCGYYFYFISRFDNNHYISAITVFIVYFLMFLCIYKAAVKFDVSKGYLFIACMFFLSTYWYYDTVSGIRNALAFSIIFAAAYYHLVERKFIPLCYFGYIFALFTHSAGIMLVLIVFIAEFTFNNSGRYINFVLIFGLVFGNVIIQYLSNRTDNGLVQFIAGQAEVHKPADSVNIPTNYAVNISALVLVALVTLYFSSYFTRGEEALYLKRFYKFCSLTIFFMIGSFYSDLVFVRFARWILPVIGAIIFMVGATIQKEKIEGNSALYYRFYATTEESIRYNFKPLIFIMFIAYTSVHLWYSAAGSSLTFMHF